MIKLFRKSNYLKTGAICALIVSLCYLAIVILALFSPASVMTYQASSQYFSEFYGYENMFVALKCLMLVANMALSRGYHHSL